MVKKMASKKFPPTFPQARKPRSLKQQLEQTRLERAIEIATDLAGKGALLTTTELARLNEVVTGAGSSTKSPKEDAPWRQEEVTLTLPSGKKETFSVIVNARRVARDKLHQATDRADCGSVLEAAVGIYVGLVQAHVFNDGNRRTAAVAAHYFFAKHNIAMSGLALHELGTRDMRDPEQIRELEASLKQIAKFTSKRKEK